MLRCQFVVPLLFLKRLLSIHVFPPGMPLPNRLANGLKGVHRCHKTGPSHCGAFGAPVWFCYTQWWGSPLRYAVPVIYFFCKFEGSSPLAQRRQSGTPANEHCMHNCVRLFICFYFIYFFFSPRQHAMRVPPKRSCEHLFVALHELPQQLRLRHRDVSSPRAQKGG